MQTIINLMTGEIIEDNIDSLITFLQASEEFICSLTQERLKAKQKLLEMAKFDNGTNTARIQGDTRQCKIELPSKINWDQQKLREIYMGGTPELVNNEFNVITEVPYYKVNMREYKKLINTSGGIIFNNYKQKLILANLGISGTPKITIET